MHYLTLSRRWDVKHETNSFLIARNIAPAVINQVFNTIVIYLGRKYLHLPLTNQKMKQKISKFETKFGVIQGFGCVDDKHIHIVCPSEHCRYYFCYRQFHSLSVLAVCVYKGAFIDVECTWPGSVHDAKVFENSFIDKLLLSSKLPAIFQIISNSEVKILNYLTDERALLPYCMREYIICILDDGVVFNSVLKSARNPIECASGRLKARWQMLTKKSISNLKRFQL